MAQVFYESIDDDADASFNAFISKVVEEIVCDEFKATFAIGAKAVNSIAVDIPRLNTKDAAKVEAVHSAIDAFFSAKKAKHANAASKTVKVAIEVKKPTEIMITDETAASAPKQLLPLSEKPKRDSLTLEATFPPFDEFSVCVPSEEAGLAPGYFIGLSNKQAGVVDSTVVGVKEIFSFKKDGPSCNNSSRSETVGFRSI